MRRQPKKSELCPQCRDLLRYARHFENCRCRSIAAMAKDTNAEKEALCSCGWADIRKRITA